MFWKKIRQKGQGIKSQEIKKTFKSRKKEKVISIIQILKKRFRGNIFVELKKEGLEREILDRLERQRIITDGELSLEELKVVCYLVSSGLVLSSERTNPEMPQDIEKYYQLRD
jgi:hypothetical protein